MIKEKTLSDGKIIILFAFLSILIIYSIFSSKYLYSTGNIFFGRNHVLYNVTLAQFFFTQAAYPVFGKEVEWSHYQLGRTYFIQGTPQGTIDETNKELALYPDNKRSYYMLGLAYGYMNQEEKAIENFQKFIDWKPDTWAARNDKAWLEFRIGKIDDALKTIEPVAHLTDNAWVQNTYGVLLMNKKKYKDAKIAFEYAKTAAEKMTSDEWGNTYPGNDPRVYTTGLKGMRLSIDTNLKLLATKK